MSKTLKRTRNFVVIFLLTFSLVLMLSIVANAQSSSISNIQIKGITRTIQGRSLVIPDFKNLSLANLDKYRSSFEMEIKKLPQFKTPLEKAAFAQLDSRLPRSILPEFLAIADNYWSKAEYTNSNIPTSQYVSGTVTCNGQNQPVAPLARLASSYLELSDMVGKNGASYGKRWISGDQMVDGGCGVLKAVNNGKEPAGRLVWGTDTFKIVLTNVDEQRQTAEFAAYMRLCANLPIGGKTCTPYFIPLPWFPVSGNNWVMVGGGVL
jgi:hypothetical protein